MTIKSFAASIGVGITLLTVLVTTSLAGQSASTQRAANTVTLPNPALTGVVAVESALHSRRSVRNFSSQPLTLAEASQLLWAGQGITDAGRKRTAPSAGALYPLELYLVAGNVSELAKGVYRYHPREHALSRVADGDQRAALASAAHGQDSVSDGAAVIVVAAAYGRTTRKYGQRGKRYVHMEVGHAAQNIHLQAVALNLGTVAVGAFDEDKVKKIVNLPGAEQPLYLLPVGRVQPR